MKKGIIALLITAGALVTVGGIVLGVALANRAFINRDFITKQHDDIAEFNNINVDVTVSDLFFKKSSDDKCHVECVERTKYYHEVSVEENTLKIKSVDKYTSIFDKMFGYNGNFKVTVFLPNITYGDLTVKSSTGDITFLDGFTLDKMNVELSTGNTKVKDVTINGDVNIKASTGNIIFENSKSANLNLNVSTGNMTLKGFECDKVTTSSSTGSTTFTALRCKNIDVKSDTGKVNYNDTIVEEHIETKVDTGDVKFYNSDANTLHIKTSTGDVRGNLLTNHRFYVKTSTGSVNVPNTDGPLCEIQTSTGDVKMEVKKI